MKFRIVLLGLLIVVSGTSQSQQTPSFTQSLLEIKLALKQSALSTAQVDDAFKHVKRVRKSIANREIAEVADAGVYGYLDKFLPQRVNEELVKEARLYFKNNLTLLKALEQKYQVQPRFLVALWGINNQLASQAHGYDALSLMASLKHQDNDVISIEQIESIITLMSNKSLGSVALRSNWQGKLGLLNMDPSQLVNSYQDYDNDGQVDIWNNQSDAFATTAQYLSLNGWNYQQTWGRQVKLPQDFSEQSLKDTNYFPLSQWNELGVRRFDDRTLPNVQVPAKLVAPDGRTGRVYLTYRNFELLNKLTGSVYETVAVGYLANRIKFPAIK